MGYLYKGYCYETINEVAQSFSADNIFPISNGLVFTNATGFIGGVVNYTLQYKTGTTTAAATTVGTLSKSYPTCTYVGPITNYSGLQLNDVVTVSWLVVLVWVSAWAVKQMRYR